MPFDADASSDPANESDDRLVLAELIDGRALQSMMDDFYALTSIPMAVLDLEGRVIVGAGWQEVCTKFHRANAQACAYCVESDTVLTQQIAPGEVKLYRCGNGMWDAATPITAGDVRVGNLFTGQFFFDDEVVDVAFFRAQARRYQFDEQAYLAAIDAVPRLSRDVVDTGLRFLSRLASLISAQSRVNLQRARAEAQSQVALRAQELLAADLVSEQAILQAVIDNTETLLAYLDLDFRFVAVNSAYVDSSGHAREELIGMNHFELFPNEENQAIFERVRDTGEAVKFRAKPFEFADQPWRGVTYWDWSLTPVVSDGCKQGFAFSLQEVTRAVREQAFSDAINGLNDVIHSTLDSGQILRQSVSELAAATRCEVVIVALRSSDGRLRLAETLGLAEPVKGKRFPGDIFEDGGSRFGLQSIFVSPLTVGGVELGCVTYGYLTGPGEFDELARDFIGKMGLSLALALNNSRLFENEHRIADRLQEALLALPDEIAGIDFGHAYHSAAEVARVGGDFYDIFQIDDNRVGITIGDVAGKGLDAAMLTSLVKNTIRAHAFDDSKTPGTVLALTNQVIYRATLNDTFVTLFFAVIDRPSGQLHYASAGHTTAVIVRADGALATLPSTGSLLGAFDGMEFEQQQAAVRIGDVLFLYTDGVTEARAGSVLYGEERLFNLLSSFSGQTPADAVSGVVADVVEHAGGHLRDDLAILAIRRIP